MGSALDVTAELRRGVALAAAGDWQGAHEIAQGHEGVPLGNWLHAIVHRLEGDPDNAAYWYRRSPRRGLAEASIDEELRLLRVALDDDRG
jgi:hypothetical protein